MSFLFSLIDFDSSFSFIGSDSSFSFIDSDSSSDRFSFSSLRSDSSSLIGRLRRSLRKRNHNSSSLEHDDQQARRQAEKRLGRVASDDQPEDARMNVKAEMWPNFHIPVAAQANRGCHYPPLQFGTRAATSTFALLPTESASSQNESGVTPTTGPFHGKGTPDQKLDNDINETCSMHNNQNALRSRMRWHIATRPCTVGAKRTRYS